MNPPGQSFQPGVAAVPATLVEISVSCRNLRDKDVLSKSDPMCVLFMRSRSGSYYEVGRTEIVKDALNPDFVQKFTVQYCFEESQKLKFEIYDVDSSSQRLDMQDFLGRVECTLGEIVACQGNQFKKNLMASSSAQYTSYGQVILVADEVISCKETVIMQYFAKNLDKKDFFGKSDPFLVFYRANEDGSFTVVHKTEVIKNTLNPKWKPFSISARALCNGDYHRTIKVECYDWDSDGGSHDFIGEFSTNLKTLSEGPGAQNEYECINPKKRAKKKSYTNSGVVKLASIRIEEEQTFLDYIKGGTQMHFTVAVDFTASNGDPRDPRSLHYIHPSQPNAYSSAIQAVGEIIQDYDSDKLFPALGFGAKLPPDGRVSHEFFLNGHPSNPYCQGVEGIISAYGRTLSTVQLYGPTNFSPVINHVAKFASTYQDGSNYFVLLIITDGVISDMPSAKEAIVRASSLPMSIIIVGVGNADFSAMEELDGDSIRISSHGRYAERDIVQFVAFRNFLHMNDWMTSKMMLAKEVLAEIPTQFLLYMKKRGIKAKPPSENPGSLPSAFSEQPAAVTPQNPGQVPPQYPGQVPPQYPGQVPPQYAGQVPPQYAGQVPPQYSGQVPPQYSGHVPQSYPGNVPPQYPGYTQPPPGASPFSSSPIPGHAPPYPPSAPAI